MARKNRIAGRVAAGLGIFVVVGFLLPERLVIPVENASTTDWNEDSFWYEPWGASGVHKGIDIFAPIGRSAVAAVGGVVVYRGTIKRGGNIVVILGPKWRLHYYAHLDSTSVRFGNLLTSGEIVGKVGNSGNATGKPSHLHYVILSVFPYPWLFDRSSQGWKRMFYIDPNRKLLAAGHN